MDVSVRRIFTEFWVSRCHIKFVINLIVLKYGKNYKMFTKNLDFEGDFFEIRQKVTGPKL